jgi:hypothetical protein
MSVARLTLGAPRGEAAQELARLLAARSALNGRIDKLTNEQRDAIARRDAAAAGLVELERKAATGDAIGDGTRRKAEQTLAAARVEAEAPWAERRAGTAAALGDHDRDVHRFIGEHFDELLAEVTEDAEAAALAVTSACERLVAAFHDRMGVEQTMTDLIWVVFNPGPNAIARTRSEAVVAAAAALLAAGGERAPVLVNDPRPPAQPDTDEPVQPEPEPADVA